MSASSSKLSKSDNTTIDTLYESFLKSADENNKVKINEFKSPSFYLPTIGNVCELLGLPSTQKQLMDLLETTYKTPLEISRSSKYDLFNKGVGLKTVSKLIDWFRKLPLPIEQLANQKLMDEVLRSQKAGSNAGNWLAAIRNFDAGFKSANNNLEHEFGPLFDFLEHRCNTEVDLLSNVRQQIQAGVLRSTDLTGAWEVQQPLWGNSPCLTSDTIENFGQTLILYSQQKNLTEEEQLNFIETYCYLSFDFYLEAISNYEVGCLFYYAKDKAKSEDDLGMITKAIIDYATDENIKTCFDGMLRQLKEVASEFTGEGISYRKLARFIEIEVDESIASGESLEDKQYNQLKDWRNGLNLPSGKKLDVFLENLDWHTGTSSHSVTRLMCRITIGIDKLINEVLARSKADRCNPSDVEAIIKKVLRTLPAYYKFNLRKQLDKREPTE